MTVAMLPDSFRAGMMIETRGPERRGAALKLGLREASRGRVRKGSSQGTAGNAAIGKSDTPKWLLDLLGNGLELLFQCIELPFDFAYVLLGAAERNTILGEECGNERVGITDHGHGHSFVDYPVQPEHDGHALTRTHGHEDGCQLANEQLAEKLQLLDDLAGREPPRGSNPAVVLTNVVPHGVDLSPQGANH